VNGVLLGTANLRAVQAGAFALRLDSKNASEITLLTGSEGGGIYADVIAVQEGGDPFARKHLGAPKYEPFAIPIGLTASPAAFDWIAGSWGANPAARSGAILAVDTAFDIRSEVAFFDALIVETRIPTLDAASKAAGSLTVRFQPVGIEPKSGAGKLNLALTKSKLWRTSNFRLEIDGLDCKKVSRIQSFAVTRPVLQVTDGSGGTVQVPGRVTFPNLTITFSQVSAASWRDWHRSFVVEGNNGDSFERSGHISFLAQDAKTELSRIELHHLGIIRIADVPSDGIGLLAAELYCEQMVLGQAVNP
jgi:hypothetical protein